MKEHYKRGIIETLKEHLETETKHNQGIIKDQDWRLKIWKIERLNSLLFSLILVIGDEFLLFLFSI